MLCRSRLFGAALLCQLVFCCASTHAVDPPFPGDKDDCEIIDKLFGAVLIDFNEYPLVDGMEFLATDMIRAPIVLDEVALKAAKIDRKLPLTYKSPRNRATKSSSGETSNFPAYRALWEMLGGANLSFVVKNHKVVITTQKAADEWQKEFVKLVESQR